jgi:hypothetical protein
MNAFMKTIDTVVIGRKTYEASLRMEAKFDAKGRTIVFSPSGATERRPIGRGFVNEFHWPVRESSSGATWQGYLVDGRRRDHRLLS